MINRLFGILINRKKKLWLIKLKIILILFLMLSVAAITVSGVAAVSSLKGLLSGMDNYMSQLLGGEHKSETEQKQWMENVSAEQILEIIQSGYEWSKAEEALIKMDKGTFVYLLQKVVDYESQGKQAKTITVEGLHEYLETVTSTEVIDGQTVTSEDSYWTEEKVTKEITVTNADTEGMLTMNWRLLYVYSLFRSIDRSGTEVLDSSDEQGWNITYNDIDAAFKILSMKYSYVVDVVRSDKSYYGYEECQELPHVEDIYNDGQSGTYTYYYPRSLMSSAVSGYSSLTYLLGGEQISGIQELYDSSRFDQMGSQLSTYYSYDLFCQLLKLTPGGVGILEKFDGYRQQGEANNFVIYTGYFNVNPGSYSVPESGSTSNGSSDPGTGGIFTGSYNSIGEAAVALARSRISWTYSQSNRMATGSWDCSSMICRVYNELGLSISASGDTSYLKRFANEHNQTISESDLRPGDVLWYAHTDGSGRHVMMYAGNGNVIHAKGVKYGTVLEPLINTGYYNNASNYGQFCFRPYLNISSSFVPNSSSSSLQAKAFLSLSEVEAAEKILALAVEDAKGSRILPSITASQMILESGYVKSGLSQSTNNCFGLKASLSGNNWSGSTWDGVRSQMWSSLEEENNVKVKRGSSFRVYDTISDSVADHSAYLLGSKKSGGARYAGITQAKNYTEAIEILVNGGYATDSKYKDKLIKVIKRYNLDRYDTSY